ncbi:hypothetical protein FQN57_001056 [Myotisia sp. PD_48]|nr:hypothetical protein FQN57_001056 [Myotisia sp. PD_48]
MSKLNPEWLAFEASVPPTEPPPNIQVQRSRWEDAARQQRERFLTEVEPEWSGLVDIRNCTVPARDATNLPVRIYDARHPNPRTIVVFYHAGGLVQGDLDTEEVLCMRLALGVPEALIFSVEYRLAPENQFPVPANDAWDSFIHIALNTKSLVPRFEAGAAPVDIILAGTSAGGQLAAIVSQLARDHLVKEPSSNWRIRGVVLRSPVTVNGSSTKYIPTQYQAIHRSWAPEFETGSLSLEVMGASHDRYNVSDKTNPLAYPLWGNLSGLPRAFIQASGPDILRDDALCYAQGLKDAGVEVESRVYDDLPHAAALEAPHLLVSQKFDIDTVEGVNWALAKKCPDKFY